MDESEVVIGAMGIVGVTMVLAMGGINNYKNFVQAHASGQQYEAASPSFTGGNAVKWVLGFGVVTVALVAATESPDLAPLAAAFAGVIALGVLFKKGGTAKDNLYSLFGQGPAPANPTYA